MTSNTLTELLHSNLIKHEGIRLRPYKDTNGHLTIGVGHNLENGISHQSVLSILDDDIAIAKAGAKRLFPNLLTYPLHRQAALIELVFNMGEGVFAKFTDTIASIHAGAWTEAADNLLDSHWAKEVGKNRANDIAEELKRND